jgi:tetratricopeptide (TPR) repeat protein
MYQRLVSEHPFSPVAVEGFYNLGLTHLRRGRLREARAAFYQVIDRAPGHEMTALAYLRIGRSHLEADEPAEALPPLRRALGIAAGSSTEPAAAVTLAATWLLTGKAAEAGSLIYDTRHLFGDDPYARCASFLAALARFRLAKEPNRAQREASDLLATLLLLDDPSAVRPVGELLMGQAYQELGLGERMALVYERALPGSRGPLAARLAYTLGDYYFAREEYTPATRRLTPLAPSAYDPWASLAQQRLAEIALARHKPQECLDWCWQLLREGRQSDQADTLRVMGRAFDRLGEYRQAARCYGGEWPLP